MTTVRTVSRLTSSHAGASNEQTRRSNLSLVLSLVHRHRVISRAELTRATGLNRSTVSNLISQLTEMELVFETPRTGSAQIGRPSPDVHPSPRTAALAVNPEVDAITIGLVGLGGEVIRRIRYETEHIPSATETAGISAAVIEGMRSELDANYRIVGIGVAVPGLTRAEDGVVSYAPHLDWHDEPIAELLHRATGYPVSAANDASLGVGAEFLFGAGVGCLDLVYLNGGASGVGGGVISAGSPRTGIAGYGGELGHTLVNSAGVACHCGARGCLETEVSLVRLQDLVGLRGADLDVVEGALLANPSPIAITEVNRQLDFLAVTLRNCVNVFNPERIILGGFLGTLFQLNPEHLRRQVISRALHGPGELVQVSRALLGSSLLLIGAGELAFANLLSDPVGALGDLKHGA